MEFNRTKAITDFIKSNEGQKFTSKEIAEWLVKTYPEEVKKKAERSKSKALINVTDPTKIAEIIRGCFSAEMKKEWYEAIQKKEPNFKKIEHPRRYYYIKETDQVEIKIAEKEPNIKEKDIYLKLS